ncbi:MAG: asparagine synthase (glutamine-hydrolyzing), partial [Deltaproteobacteria bacterium]|nr:asparagine synthase (glutamine-hydrolyzing) [Deltaproteobacteria bacterium]
PPSMAQAAEEWNGNRPPTLVLGHRRLAIIDLSAHGHQPMSAAEGSLWITYNGELYNFVELRSELAQLGVSFQTGSDTEVVLKAYEMWGPEAVKRFVGMWAFALLDLRMRHLMLSRDRFGIKPLHYHVSPNGFAFASEIKQLLVTPGVPNRINERCVYDYLQFEAVDAGPETFFTGINKLEPGNNLFVSLDTGEVGKTCYYTPPEFGTLQQISTADAAEQFRALLKDSVRIHLRADVPVGTCLSGGLDSSSIAMLMREVAREAGLELDRHSFSSHFDAPEADELEYTRMSIAASEVVPHFVAPTAESLLADLRKLVWHQDEPFGSTSIYAQWTVFRLIQQHGIKVVLDGQGSDEMLGGYASTMPHFLLELAGRGPAWKALWESWRWARLQGTSWTSQIPYPTLRRALTRVLRQASVASLADPPWLNSEFADRYSGSSQYLANMGQHPFGPGAHFSNILYQFFFLNNLPSLLRYEDRNSMAFSVEARVPFLDHRLVEFVFSLPARLKIRNGYTKRVLRDSMAGTLPERIRMRARKMGFATPERQWQIGPLRQLIREAIASSRLASFIRPEVASRHFEAVLDSNRLSFAPWRWLNLWLWAEEFRVG